MAARPGIPAPQVSAINQRGSVVSGLHRPAAFGVALVRPQAGVAFPVQVLIVEMSRGRPLTRRVIEDGVLDIPDGLVQLVGGVADLAVRGVIAH